MTKNEKRKLWRQENKELFAASRKAYRLANLERFREQRKATYARHREKEIAAVRQYQQSERGRKVHRACSSRFTKGNAAYRERLYAKKNLKAATGIAIKDLDPDIVEAEVLRLRLRRVILEAKGGVTARCPEIEAEVARLGETQHG